jgi:hypothetical protein
MSKTRTVHIPKGRTVENERKGMEKSASPSFLFSTFVGFISSDP